MLDIQLYLIFSHGLKNEMIDIKEKDLEIVKGILSRYAADREVQAFGSRCNGKAKSYSDLDLVIMGENIVPAKIMHEIIDSFDESDIPFRVDILDWNAITNEFRDVIMRGAHEVIKNAGE